jgi:hypothetical protein
MKAIAKSVPLCLLLCSCHTLGIESDFHFVFEGYSIDFPITLKKAIEVYGLSRDTLNKWRFIKHDEKRGTSIAVIPRPVGSNSLTEDNDFVYAVSFVLINKSYDSLKNYIEQNLGLSFRPFKINSTPYSSAKELLRLEVDRSNTILLDKYKLDQRSIVKISFCHGINEEELGLFVARDGIIWEDD